jgi:toxin FitB
MILLDTNILSELMRPTSEAAVERWLTEQPIASIFICAITEAELRYGLALMPSGKRRSRLAIEIVEMLEADFKDRILPFDSPAAIAFAAIAAERRHAGRPISQSDAQIAAIARSRGAALDTRNAADFEECGVDAINPWPSA